MVRTAVELDDTDRRIVALLQADGRMSIREVAERAHVSRTNAYARLDRLRATGVITGFTAVVDPERYGIVLSAYIAVKVRQNVWRRFRGRLADIPEVHHAALVSGDFDVLLLVRTTDLGALRDLVLERLQDMPEVLTTQTLFILDEFNRTPGPAAP
ncbi:Lrp/AsnC family transcriptional regulator [Allonocardiopsis opalescens]|uniref:AsnC family transcriptional regulator n=1 Tax=Allonocardiopsis opalescens TaxID=1144618 RepID=A0A2T0QFN1_9ACTN|nr:Lrp/AsnC family transcriptional regulator [Allonocardiopsis opalescens]PRY02744.1 AsnC family transcriptional regulator [Allonocardiopsis opalescens]